MQNQKPIGDEIIKLSANVNKDGPARKTEKYKIKKLAKLKELWDLFESNDNEIKMSMANDSAYDAYYDQIKKVWTALKKNLEGIVAPATGDDQEIDATEAEISRQEVRFNSLGRILTEVSSKITNNELMSVAYCKLKLKNMEDTWERITKSHEDIAMNPDVLKSYFNSYENIQSHAEAMMLALQEILESVQPAQGMGQRNDGLQLKRVALPKFFGDYFKWITFRDLFTGMVKENSIYTNAQKLQLLKTNIGGEAEGLIQDLTISDANFDDAWNRLLERYDDNRNVVHQFIAKLMAQPMIKTEAKSLKSLLDTTQQVILTLKNLDRSVEHWGDWIVVVVSQKLHDECRKDWEKEIRKFTDLPTWDDLRTFMQDQFKMMENVESNTKRQQANFGQSKHVKSYHASVNNGECPACREDHTIWKCAEFKKMAVNKRWDIAKKGHLCFKCLSSEHDKGSCERENPCKKCKKGHSTWLHEERSKKTQAYCATKGEKSEEQSGGTPKDIKANVGIVVKNSAISSAYATTQEDQVLLATAVISTLDKFGNRVWLRALIDTGSQGSMMTEEASRVLQMKPVTSTNTINPLGGGPSMTTKRLTIQIRPHFTSRYELVVECYILRKLTNTMPDTDLNTEKWSHIRGLQWADPKFYKVGKIDVLLGADVVADIMKEGLIKGRVGEPIAQLTTLGWIISGKININYKNKINCFVATMDQGSSSLNKFWELEELNPVRNLTVDEQRCEDLYNATVTRDETGRIMVRMPFKDGNLGPSRLGHSRGQALARFNQLEKKFMKDQDLKAEYVKSMNEYIDLGHLVEVTTKPESEKLYYIPHHAVQKPDSLTTKTRVVFDSSAKTSTGVSLNECTYTGRFKRHSDAMEDPQNCVQI